MITFEKSWFLRYLTDSLGLMNGCYVGKDLEDEHTYLLREPIKVYEA